MKIKFKKINVSQIIKMHFETLVNSNTNKTGIDDWVTFLLLPLIVTLSVIYFKPVIPDSSLNLVITGLSIFVGLLINVVVLIFSLIQKEDAGSVKEEVLKETIVNICYTILVSIITIVFAFLMFIDNIWIKYILSFLIYFLSIHFFITLLMVIKRMFLLFINEIDDFKNR